MSTNDHVIGKILFTEAEIRKERKSWVKKSAMNSRAKSWWSSAH